MPKSLDRVHSSRPDRRNYRRQQDRQHQPSRSPCHLTPHPFGFQNRIDAAVYNRELASPSTQIEAFRAEVIEQSSPCQKSNSQTGDSKEEAFDQLSEIGSEGIELADILGVEMSQG